MHQVPQKYIFWKNLLMDPRDIAIFIFSVLLLYYIEECTFLGTNFRNFSYIIFLIIVLFFNTVNFRENRKPVIIPIIHI